MRYLKGTFSFGLQITCSSSFTLHDLQILFGLVMLVIISQQVVISSILIFTPISWKSSKQRTIA
jgi:hypothetical protein